MEWVVINLIFNVVASDHASPQVKNLMDLKVGKNESENGNKARIRQESGIILIRTELLNGSSTLMRLCRCCHTST